MTRRFLETRNEGLRSVFGVYFPPATRSRPSAPVCRRWRIYRTRILTFLSRSSRSRYIYRCRIDSPTKSRKRKEEKRKGNTREISRANNTLSANNPNHTYLRPTEKKAERRARMRQRVDIESSPLLVALGARPARFLRPPSRVSELLASCRYCRRSFAPFRLSS